MCTGKSGLKGSFYDVATSGLWYQLVENHKNKKKKTYPDVFSTLCADFGDDEIWVESL